MVTMDKQSKLLVVLKIVELKHLSMFYNYKHFQLETIEDELKLLKDLHQVLFFNCRFCRKREGATY